MVYAHPAPSAASAAPAWVPVSEPSEHGAYLCMVRAQGAQIAYPRVVWFGYYEFVADETPVLQPGQQYNEDDAMVRGIGWHDEVEQWGGEHDFVTVLFNEPRGDEIVSYFPAPIPRRKLPAAPAASDEGEGK